MHKVLVGFSLVLIALAVSPAQARYRHHHLNNYSGLNLATNPAIVISAILAMGRASARQWSPVSLKVAAAERVALPK